MHHGLTVWFTGLSGAGKTTLSNEVHRRLVLHGCRVQKLDGDEIRTNLCKDLGFTREGREENIRRIGWVASLLTRHDVIVLVSAISPYRKARDEARAQIKDFVEVYVNSPLEVCESRDVKGLYRKARTGEISGFTGVSDPYEPPLNPELECRTSELSVSECADQVIEHIIFTCFKFL